MVRLTLFAGGKRVLSIAEWMSEKDVPYKFLLTNILDVCKDWDVDVFSLYLNVSDRKAKESLQSIFVRRGRAPIILANTAEGLEVSTIKDPIYYLGNTDAV